MPVATLRSWVRGRTYSTTEGDAFSARLIRLPNGSDARLSFINLVEAHVLRSLRTRHGISMRDVRKALDYAQREFGIDRLLIRKELKAAPGRLFFEQYTRLVELPKGGQLALREVFDAHLERVIHDAHALPIRLFPWMRVEGTEARTTIAVDPRIAFGNPVVARRSISTAVIADRFDAGESLRDLAVDYDLDDAEIKDAIAFERAA
jgi:uncharacterized protein (DUF433 family)